MAARRVLLLAAALRQALAQTCSTGQYVDSGGCSPCPDGSASDGTASACTPCAAGSFATPADPACAPCAAGFACPLAVAGDPSAGTVKNQCPSGTAAAAAQGECETCGVGEFSVAGAAAVAAVDEACVVYCGTGNGYTQGTAASPSTTCPSGCTLTPAVAGVAPEPAACSGTATDAAHNCASAFAAQSGTAEVDCISGTGAGCTYVAAISAVSAEAEVCAGTSTADCSFTPGDPSSCPSQGSPTGCAYIAASSAIDAEPGAASCSNCTAGKIGTAAGSSGCADCSAGTYSVGGTSSCQSCSEGFICTGGTDQAACPVGQTSVAGASSCEGCPVGRYGASTDGTPICEACPAGQYTEAVGQLLCQECPPAHRCPGGNTKFACYQGKYQPDTGQTSCISCPAGKSSPSTAETCTECGAGRYSSSSSGSCKSCPGGYFCPPNSNKQACPAGKYSNGKYPASYTPDDSSDVYSPSGPNGATICLSCSAGKYTAPPSGIGARRSWNSYPQEWVCGDCTPGYECGAGSDRVVCPSGRFAAGAASSCTDCAAGQYSEEGAATCPVCEPGTYCPGKLGRATHRCCPGGPLSHVGTTACPASLKDADHPERGICTREAPDGLCGGSGTCSGWGLPGTGDGDGSCTGACGQVSSLICVSGTFSLAGQSLCTNCDPGKYSYANNGSCAPCSPGYFCVGGPVVEVAPQIDDAGFNDPALRLNSHHAMPHLAPSDELTSRQFCPNGTWSNDTRLAGAAGDFAILAWCANCTAGMYSLRGATSCQNCTAGKYTEPGWPTCRNCTRSFYCPGGMDRQPCPSGFFSEEGEAQCTGCPEGRYAKAGAESCSVCDQGYWCPGATDRVACTAGTWSNNTGASSSETCETCDLNNLLLFDPCLPGGKCAEGHRNDFCLDCVVEPHPYYKVADECVPCPENTTLIMAVAGSIFLVFAIIMLRMGSAGKKRDKGGVGNKVTVPFSILFTNLQITMKFYELNLQWPQFVLDIIEQLGQALDLDFVELSMADPSCSIQFDNPGEGYRFRQNLVAFMLPAFCGLIALIHLVSSLLMSTMAMSGNRMQAYCYLIRTVPGEVANACVTAFSTMYMGIVASSFESWHCSTRVKAELHMDKHPNIPCSFTDGSYFAIFTVGTGMFIVYALAFPASMAYALWSRNLRYVPADKAAYEDPPNCIVDSTKKCCRGCSKCLLKTLLSPVLILAWLFQDKESQRLVREEEAEREKRRKHDEEQELQLETRTKGGWVGEDSNCEAKEAEGDEGGEVDGSRVEGDSARWLLVSSAPVSADGEEADSLELVARLRGGKAAKKAAMKAAREKEENWKREEKQVKKKKKVKKQPKQKEKRIGALNSYSYKEEFGKEDKSAKKPTRKLRKDLLSQSLPTDKASKSAAGGLRAETFSELHHTKSAAKKGRTVRSTQSWMEQADEGETEAASGAKERVAKGASQGLGSSPAAQRAKSKNKVLPESSAAQQAANKRLRGDGKAKRRCGKRPPPEYEVDETETDGYIYWHEPTRRQIGWVYLRFRPKRWYFEFVYMMRKVAILAVTTFLGTTVSGHAAWACTFIITLAALFAQIFLSPFPEDRAARYSQTLFPCCPEMCSPHRGAFKALVRVLMSFANPSLNDLELAGILCQLVTLACGLGCLLWGVDGKLDGETAGEKINFVLGVISLGAMLLFVTVVLTFWNKAIWGALKQKLFASDEKPKRATAADKAVEGEVIEGSTAKLALDSVKEAARAL